MIAFVPHRGHQQTHIRAELVVHEVQCAAARLLHSDLGELAVQQPQRRLRRREALQRAQRTPRVVERLGVVGEEQLEQIVGQIVLT